MSELHFLVGQLVPSSMRARLTARLDELLAAMAEDDDEPREIDVSSWRHAMEFLGGSGIVEAPMIGLWRSGQTLLQWSEGEYPTKRSAALSFKPDGTLIWSVTDPVGSGYGNSSDFDLGAVAPWVFANFSLSETPCQSSLSTT